MNTRDKVIEYAKSINKSNPYVPRMGELPPSYLCKTTSATECELYDEAKDKEEEMYLAVRHAVYWMGRLMLDRPYVWRITYLPAEKTIVMNARLLLVDPALVSL